MLWHRCGAGNLPAELTSFVGRRGEVAEVRRLLGDSRLVTLTGVGGVGKTRLALRAAAGLRRAFGDGVWLVQLDQLRDEALVAQAVAGVLGLQPRAGLSPEAALAGYVADRQLLLVLDNCEHLVDAAAKLADQLLHAAAGLRVLATSRESLNITGEMVLPVPPLAAPDPGRPLTLAQLRMFPAAALFAARAGQVVPGFAVTDANKAAVAGICHRVEGMPLAIELAAARTRVLSPEQIEARLGDRLGLLTRGSRTRPARQQTLRASIEWSYELCTESERLLWARLSVFTGGFELDAAEGICADDRLAAEQVLELLAALADKSVLIAEHLDAGVRYRLPETLREFGQERLQESGKYTVLRRWHRDWYEQLAAQADTGWLSPEMTELAAARARALSPEQIQARLGDRLGLLTRGSRANPARQRTLRTSIEWNYELCSQAERLLWARLSVFAGGFGLDAAEGICADDRLAAEDVLDLLAALADKSVLIAEHGAGVVRYRLPEILREYGQERLQESGEYTALRRRHRDWYEQLARQADTGWLSRQTADRVARLFREHANVQAAQDFCQAEPGEAEAGLRIAMHVWLFYYVDGGYVSEGRYRLGQALARSREPTVWRVRGLLLASLLATASGDRDAALPLLEQGTSLARQLDDSATRAFAAYCAAVFCTFGGDLQQAIAHYEDGLEALPAAAVHARQRALLLLNLANAAGLAGDEERAVACHREFVALTGAGGELSHPSHSGYWLWVQGLAAWRRGDLDRAAGLQQQSLRLRAGLNDLRRSTLCVEALAWIAASGRQYERATVLLGTAAGLWRSMGTTLDGYGHLVGFQRDCERQARQALGETAFQAAYHRGLEMAAEDALAYALQQPPEEPPKKPPAPAVSGGVLLTPRELQVARLLARGRSNKEIAAQLVISQRTAEGHVERILTKLGFASRAQVAAWAASQPDDAG